jgi:hypothetical protein
MASEVVGFQQVLGWLADEYQNDPTNWQTTALSARSAWGTVSSVNQLMDWLETVSSDEQLSELLNTEQGRESLINWFGSADTYAASEQYPPEQYPPEQYPPEHYAPGH